MIQEQAILEHLLRGEPITALTALQQYGCLRLAARIHDIRRAMPVKATKLKLPNGKRVASYSIDGLK